MAHKVESYAGRKPAWHQLGTVFGETDLTAAEAAERLEFGVPDVELIDIPPVELPDGRELTIPFRVITRTDGDTPKVLGSPVSLNWELLTHRDVIEMYDQNVKRPDGTVAPVETMGTLKNGEIFFVTTQLPKVQIKDEEIEPFLLIGNPLDGKSAAEAAITNIRVVCYNTWIAALHTTEGHTEIGRERHSVSHHAGIKEDLAAWMAHLYNRYLSYSNILAEAYNALADKMLTVQDFTWIQNKALPHPAVPNREEYPPHIYERRLRQYESLKKSRDRWLDMWTEFYEGRALGSDTEAFKGTAWGAFQSAVEIFNWGGRNTKPDVRAQSILSGFRNNRANAAFDACMELVTAQ